MSPLRTYFGYMLAISAKKKGRQQEASQGGRRIKDVFQDEHEKHWINFNGKELQKDRQRRDENRRVMMDKESAFCWANTNNFIPKGCDYDASFLIGDLVIFLLSFFYR